MNSIQLVLSLCSRARSNKSSFHDLLEMGGLLRYEHNWEMEAPRWRLASKALKFLFYLPGTET